MFFFGTNFVPVKTFESGIVSNGICTCLLMLQCWLGDGFFFQFIMCQGVFAVGALLTLDPSEPEITQLADVNFNRRALTNRTPISESIARDSLNQIRVLLLTAHCSLLTASLLTASGQVVNAIQGYPKFEPLAMLGGFLWAVGERVYPTLCAKRSVSINSYCSPSNGLECICKQSWKRFVSGVFTLRAASRRSSGSSCSNIVVLVAGGGGGAVASESTDVAVGNLMAVPIIKCIGISLGLLIWGATNMMIGWGTGTFGWFDLEDAERPISKPVAALLLLLPALLLLLLLPALLLPALLLLLLLLAALLLLLLLLLSPALLLLLLGLLLPALMVVVMVVVPARLQLLLLVPPLRLR